MLRRAGQRALRCHDGERCLDERRVGESTLRWDMLMPRWRNSPIRVYKRNESAAVSRCAPCAKLGSYRVGATYRLAVRDRCVLATGLPTLQRVASTGETQSNATVSD
jgi:hypothetical protein